ncbi:MAG: hypothetical protein AAGB26_04510 [Planctomycetota bacterium]
MSEVVKKDMVFSLMLDFGESKRKSHQDLMRKVYKAYITYFQEKGLVTRQILAEDEYPSAETEIHPEDLTDDGYELIWDLDCEWLVSVQTGGDINDTSLLDKKLHEIRQARQQQSEGAS